MKKTALEIYALIVCFVTVICFIVCLGIFGYSLVQASKPDFTLSSYNYDKFQSNDAYWENCDKDRYCSGDDKKSRIRPSDDELTKRRTEAFANALVSERRDGAQTLVRTIIIMLVDALALCVHWIIAKRARSNTAI